MNRERYIELRRKNSRIVILYEAARERNYKGDIMTLTIRLKKWPVDSNYKEHLIDCIISFYDIKFNVVLANCSTTNNLLNVF